MARLVEMGSVIKNVDVPSGMDAESLNELRHRRHRNVLMFRSMTFVNCRFKFAYPEDYVFMGCRFIGCDISTLRKDRMISCDTDLNCVGLRGFNCPPTGSFEAWKACVDVWTNELVLAKLFVPEYAHRVTVPFDCKFRVSIARVKGLYFADGSESKKALSIYDPAFTYEPNAELLPGGEWEQNNMNCAAGIHAFMDPYDAIDYGSFMAAQVSLSRIRRTKAGKIEIVHREDGSCPYPLRMAPGFPRGKWEWVDKLLLGKEENDDQN